METTLTKDELKNMPEYKEQRSGGHPGATISASAGGRCPVPVIIIPWLVTGHAQADDATSDVIRTLIATRPGRSRSGAQPTAST